MFKKSTFAHFDSLGIEILVFRDKNRLKNVAHNGVIDPAFRSGIEFKCWWLTLSSAARSVVVSSWLFELGVYFILILPLKKAEYLSAKIGLRN